MGVILIGYRGSGKTTVGRRLADRLWWPFVDSDDLIVSKAGGMTISDIFARHGEAYFRDLEVQAVAELCALQDHVIALSGGALGRQENRRTIGGSGHRVIYLRCDAEVLLDRIQSDPRSAATRPNLTSLGGGIDEIRCLLEEREPAYRQTMHAELDVTHLTAEEAVARIARLI